MSQESPSTASLSDATSPAPKRAKTEKAVIPEGMSKNAWKKLQKQKRWEEQKDEYRLKRAAKKKALRQRKAENRANGTLSESDNYHMQPKKLLPESQSPSGVKVIMDCEFDDLMIDKEIVSMSNQITRCYLAKRHAKYHVDFVVSTFNKRLKQRFDKTLPEYHKWTDMNFLENKTLSELLPTDPEEFKKYVYLTADTEEELEELEEGHTYIIGGIVDKNRHKMLCVNKAKELGLRVARLPIGKYIQMNSRHVLATSHVYEIMCLWFELDRDWGKAFNAVLPPRKLKAPMGGKAKASDGAKVESEDDEEVNEESVGEATGENKELSAKLEEEAGEEAV